LGASSRKEISEYCELRGLHSATRAGVVMWIDLGSNLSLRLLLYIFQSDSFASTRLSPLSSIHYLFKLRAKDSPARIGVNVIHFNPARQSYVEPFLALTPIDVTFMALGQSSIHHSLCLCPFFFFFDSIVRLQISSQIDLLLHKDDQESQASNTNCNLPHQL
jgi:hypothetical protein